MKNTIKNSKSIDSVKDSVKKTNKRKIKSQKTKAFYYAFYSLPQGFKEWDSNNITLNFMGHL